ncbi:MAG: hypothetical protein HY822_02820 [Acidobacteria bacterium]|nr:hypothetical protein [Acidobacteriota bacterium]
MKPARRILLLVAILLVAAGLAAPFFRADRFAVRIRSALEQGLGRQVEIGEVRFNLFTGPGFTVRNVVIYEDPAAGLEPLAYVAEMDARADWWSLVTGRLEFSNLRLLEPSVNLAKPHTGGWNLQPLLSRAAATARSQGARPPALQIRGGRVNFKFGDVKSVFYLSNADVDFRPSAEAIEFRFEGEPARTDRGAQGFGRLAGRGRWRPQAPSDRQFELDLSLERSNIGEIVRLFHGRDIGLHGMVASRAKLTGPLSDIRVAGRLDIEDIHRWDLMPHHGQAWPVDFRGRIDLEGQRVELETLAPPGQTLPVSVRFRAAELLARPRWATVFTVRDLPVANVVEVARHFGAVPASPLALEGLVEGAIGYSGETGLQGLFLLRDVSVAAPESPALRIERARIEVDRSRIRAHPATVLAPAGRAVQVEAEFHLPEQTLDVLAATRGLPAADLNATVTKALGGPAVPVLEACSSGLWKGWVRYRRIGEGAGNWSGLVELQEARLAVEGLASPLAVRSAQVQIDGDKAVLKRIQAQAGRIAFQGEFRQEGGKDPSGHFRLEAAEADAAELEQVFAPALLRQRGLLARTLRLVRGGVPEWLRARRAEGVVAIGALTAGDLRWENVKARLVWNGTTVDIAEFGAAWGEGRLRAKGSVSLASAAPVYRLQGSLSGLDWHAASIGFEGRAESAGAGEELLQNLRLDGAWSAAGLTLSEDLECRRAQGRVEFAMRRGLPLLKLMDIEAALGEETWEGQGASLPDGRLSIDLTSGKKELRLTGRLSPFHLIR